MAVNGTSVSVSQYTLPTFKGENYEFWSLKMNTLFHSQDLGDLVEKGYHDPDEESRRKEKKKKKHSKALLFIQQAMTESIFLRIAIVSISKQAWTTL